MRIVLVVIILWEVFKYFISKLWYKLLNQNKDE
jgi:hypothetical protein